MPFLTCPRCKHRDHASGVDTLPCTNPTPCAGTMVLDAAASASSPPAPPLPDVRVTIPRVEVAGADPDRFAAAMLGTPASIAGGYPGEPRAAGTAAELPPIAAGPFDDRPIVHATEALGAYLRDARATPLPRPAHQRGRAQARSVLLRALSAALHHVMVDPHAARAELYALHRDGAHAVGDQLPAAPPELEARPVVVCPCGNSDAAICPARDQHLADYQQAIEIVTHYAPAATLRAGEYSVLLLRKREDGEAAGHRDVKPANVSDDDTARRVRGATGAALEAVARELGTERGATETQEELRARLVPLATAARRRDHEDAAHDRVLGAIRGHADGRAAMADDVREAISVIRDVALLAGGDRAELIVEVIGLVDAAVTRALEAGGGAPA